MSVCVCVRVCACVCFFMYVCGGGARADRSFPCLVSFVSSSAPSQTLQGHQASGSELAKISRDPLSDGSQVSLPLAVGLTVCLRFVAIVQI